jgi:hypothetical protein
MSDTPMDVSYNATVTNPTPANPSSNINPGVGMKKPQYMLNQSRPTGPGIHNKPGVRIWSGSAFAIGKSITAEIIAPSTYQGCDCATCKEMNVDCPDCPVCANPIPDEEGMSEMKANAPLPENPIMPTNTYQGVSDSNKKKKYRAAKAIDESTILKDMVAEGDFVITVCDDETHVGIVQYVMTEGIFGVATSYYSIEASTENPVILIRILELDEEDGLWEESEYLIGAESEMVTKIEPLILEVETVINESQDSEVSMAMYDSSIGKADPCWEGYVQRGMKPGADGNPVPNCIPVTKTESIFFSAKDYSKQTRVTNLFKD